MPNTRQPAVYISDANVHYLSSIPTKYATLSGMATPGSGDTTPLPKGLRRRVATLRTHIADATGAPGHYLERRVHCNLTSLASGGPLAKGTVITGLDYAGDGTSWVVQGWTGERLKAIV